MVHVSIYGHIWERDCNHWVTTLKGRGINTLKESTTGLSIVLFMAENFLQLYGLKETVTFQVTHHLVIQHWVPMVFIRKKPYLYNKAIQQQISLVSRMYLITPFTIARGYNVNFSNVLITKLLLDNCSKTLERSQITILGSTTSRSSFQNA